MTKTEKALKVKSAKTHAPRNIKCVSLLIGGKRTRIPRSKAEKMLPDGKIEKNGKMVKMTLDDRVKVFNKTAEFAAKFPELMKGVEFDTKSFECMFKKMIKTGDFELKAEGKDALDLLAIPLSLPILLYKSVVCQK